MRVISSLMAPDTVRIRLMLGPESFSAGILDFAFPEQFTELKDSLMTAMRSRC